MKEANFLAIACAPALALIVAAPAHAAATTTKKKAAENAAQTQQYYNSKALLPAPARLPAADDRLPGPPAQAAQW